MREFRIVVVVFKVKDFHRSTGVCIDGAVLAHAARVESASETQPRALRLAGRLP